MGPGSSPTVVRPGAAGSEMTEQPQESPGEMAWVGCTLERGALAYLRSDAVGAGGLGKSSRDPPPIPITTTPKSYTHYSIPQHVSF